MPARFLPGILLRFLRIRARTVNGVRFANRTETLSVSFVSSEPLDVYLVTFEQFINLMGVSSCVPGGALFFMNNVTSYELNMEIPYSGDFILLFVNHSLKPLTLILLKFELSTMTSGSPGRRHVLLNQLPAAYSEHNPTSNRHLHGSAT